MADFALLVNPRTLDRDEIVRMKRALVLYVDSDLASTILMDPPSGWKPSVLIIAGTDLEFRTLPQNLPDSLRGVFVQNSFVSDNERVWTLPIGLEDRSLGMNGRPKYFRPEPARKREPRLLLGPFSPTHSVREETVRLFSAVAGPWTISLSQLPPSRYNVAMRSHSHVGAVRGNGVDTHRVWESIYRGAIPVVTEDSWSKSLVDFGAPLRTVSKWDPEEVRDLVERTQSHGPLDPYSLPLMWMDFWRKFIDRLID